MAETPTSSNRPKNAFEFVTVASARARQLLKGCTPKIDGSPKPARRALQEVAQGVVTRYEPPAAE
jgi:DNA-directed RNA polymerase subunit K/omega